jgi:hypothetical protein
MTSSQSNLVLGFDAGVVHNVDGWTGIDIIWHDIAVVLVIWILQALIKALKLKTSLNLYLI